MASVLDTIQCPNCGKDAHSDFYYKTGEEYVNCMHCGYAYSFTFKRDENGEYELKDKTVGPLLTNCILEEEELKTPHAAIQYQHVGSVGYSCSSLEDADEESKFREFVKTNTAELSMAKISKYHNGEHTVEYLIGQEEVENDEINEQI